eukprot:3921778-Pyramimonas_sp.AAC.1
MKARSLVTRRVMDQPQLRRLPRCIHFSDDIGGCGLRADFPGLYLHKGCGIADHGAVRDVHAPQAIPLPADLFFFFSTRLSTWG